MNTLYYREQLSNSEQQLYDRVNTGICKLEGEIALPFSTDISTIGHVFTALRNDKPEAFFVDRRYTLIKRGNNSSLKLSYCYSVEEIKSLLKKTRSTAKDIAAKISGKREIEKILILHDLLVKRLNYDSYKSRGDEAHSMIGPLLHEKGVCEGYSKAFKQLCDNAGIYCIIVNGTAIGQNGKTGGHAWNIVRLNGKYYHIDVTHDHYLDDKYCSRFHCLLSDKDIGINHTADDEFTLPVCPETLPLVKYVPQPESLVTALTADANHNSYFTEYRLGFRVNGKSFADKLINSDSSAVKNIRHKIERYFYSENDGSNYFAIKWRA